MVLLFLLLLAVNVLADDRTCPVVSVKQGFLQGYQKYNQCWYSGIPYGKAPIGEYRFQEAEAAPSWNGTLNATKECDSCVQYLPSISGSEDCLCLNVYRPAVITKKVAVLVFLHGGGFQVLSSNSSLYNFHWLVEQNVLVVSFNYRLNVFGFLSTKDAAAPGNAGLKDQQLALRWVQQNIHAFGGDPNNVTLWGTSSGAASCGFHLIAPGSKGLFQKTILESGSPACSWARQLRPKENVQNLGKCLNLSTYENDTAKLVKHLKSLPAYDLALLARTCEPDWFKSYATPIKYTASRETCGIGTNYIFTENPFKLIKEGKYNTNVSILIGGVSDEGTFPLITQGATAGTRDALNAIDLRTVERLQKDMLVCPIDPKGVNVAKSIRNHYLDSQNLTLDNIGAFEQMWGDVYFKYCDTYTARYFSEYSKHVYLYEFSYIGGLDVNKLRSLGALASLQKRPGHGFEEPYLEDTGLEYKAGSTDDIVRQRLVKIFTNFAKYAVSASTGLALVFTSATAIFC